MILAILLSSVSSYAHGLSYLEVVDELRETSSHVDGPNCWNGALVAAGVLKNKRFINPDEWLFHLEQSCREIDGPEPGAVGRLFHPEDGEVHGFIHLNEKMIFEKLGEDKQHGYQVVTYEEMLTQYGKTRSCRINSKDDPECFHKLVYYRCHTQAVLHPRLERAATLTEELIFSDETKWFHKVTCEDSTFLRHQEVTSSLNSELQDLLTDLKREESLSAFVSNPLHKAFLEGLAHQIYNVEVSLRNFRCRDRKLKNKAIKEVKKTTRSLRQLFQ